MTALRVLAIAGWLATVAAWSSTAAAQDAGVSDDAVGSDDARGPADAGGPDASTRVLIDGPTMLGIGRPQVAGSASPSELRLGEKLTLFIEVTYDDQVTVSLPSGLDLQPSFDELKRSSVDERRNDGTRKRTYQLQLQVWELGDLRIPPIQVAYTVGGQQSWVVTNDVPIRVVGTIDAIDDPNAFLGAAPPVGLRSRDWRWIVALAGVGALAGGLLCAWLYRRWRRRVRPAVEPSFDGQVAVERAPVREDDGADPSAREHPEAVAPAFTLRHFVVTHELRRQLGDAARRALDQLDDLERGGLLVTDQVDGFRRMVSILHGFAVAQHHLPPRHRTTADLLAALDRTAMPAPARAAFAGWLEGCDRVKYGDDRVDDAGARALSDARALIVRDAGLPVAAPA